MLPRDFIEEVKNSVDLVELVSRYTDLSKVGTDTYAGRCPNPNHKDSDPSFLVFADQQSWCCYGCHQGNKYKGKNHDDTNYGSDCFAFLQWINKGKINVRQAILQLAKEHNLPIPSEENTSAYKKNSILTKCYQMDLKDNALEYMIQRGLSEKDCKDWQIGWDGHKFVFPLFDKYKRICGYSRRWKKTPEGRSDKYRNSSASSVFFKSNYLYGMHLLDTNEDYIYITEGTLDVILSNKYGLKNVVGTLGTSFTDNHALEIKRLKKIPIFIMDGDEAGLKAIHRAINKLSAINVHAKLVILPEGKDLADMSNELKEGITDYIVQNTITYGYFLSRTTIDSYNQKLYELRQSLYPELKQIIKNAPDIEKDILIDFIANSIGVNISLDSIK